MWPEKAGLERLLNKRANNLGNFLEIERKREEEGGVLIQRFSDQSHPGDWMDGDGMNQRLRTPREK